MVNVHIIYCGIGLLFPISLRYLKCESPAACPSLSFAQSLFGWLIPFGVSSYESCFESEHTKYCFRHLACALEVVELLGPALLSENCHSESVSMISKTLQCLTG